MIEFLMVSAAPKPVAPFSHATSTEGWLFVTGQIPTDPDDDAAPLPEGIEAQTRRVIENLKRVLVGVGSGLDRVVAARVYLTHFERDYAAMNDVYRSLFCARAPTGAHLHRCHRPRPRRTRRNRSVGTQDRLNRLSDRELLGKCCFLELPE